jgi:DNA polymerase-3 subunit beta
MKNEVLNNTIKKLKKAIGKKNTLPVLDNIFNDNGKMTVTDLGTTYTVNTGFSGKFLIDFKSLDKILSKVSKNSEINIYPENDKIIVLVDNKGKFSFIKNDVDSFPSFPKCEKSLGVLDNHDITLIKKAVKYTANDDLRPTMKCVFIHKHIVASDSYKLVYYKHENKLSQDILIPNTVIKLMNDDIYSVFIGEKNINLVNDNESILFRICEGNYPAYQKVIPKNNNIIYKINTKELKEVINMAMITANPYTNLVIFNFNNSKLTISSQDIDMDTNFSTTIDVKSKDNKPIKIGLKGTFVLDLLNDCEEISTFKMSDPSHAILIDNDKLLMPIMINN